MYDSPSDARAALSDAFEPTQVELLLAALAPAIVFEAADADRLGATRLGGLPDLPPDLDWPRPTPPEDPEAIARRGNAEAGAAMRRHLSLGLPMAFFAQVDLAEAEALGAVAAPLPREGRLLFFYDYLVGPWDSSARVARVIWDRSPPDRLSPRAMPADLAAEAAHEWAEIEAVLARYGRSRHEGTSYGAPAQPMRLATTWRLPDPHCIECDSVAGLEWHTYETSSSPFAEAYGEFFSDFADELFDDHALRHQLLGYPTPEQQDPRLKAAVAARFGVPHLPSERRRAEFPAIKAEAQSWRLVLQIAICDWMQADLCEGTVYFVIREADLAARNFDEVVAVYQQT